VRILNCIGLRAEESPGREARAPFEQDKRSSGRRKQVDIWLPIQAWTEAEVWAACRASGARIHPAYAAGLPRASCVLCIFAPREALIVAGRLHPELLAEYVEVEREIEHDFKHRLPIARVAEDVAAGVVPHGAIGNWCM
jgi:3'-phosphoadenosine 5'-phosphosulfate sulfotransferase (PAPS reductase)/FAD synthetase